MEKGGSGIGHRKIGEVVAWNNEIIGMCGKWRDGVYDVFKVDDGSYPAIGYTIIHQDADWKFSMGQRYNKYEYSDELFNVKLGGLGTDVGEINFAGMQIGTGGDGKWNVWGLYEDIKDYYAREQNNPRPVAKGDMGKTWQKMNYEKNKWMDEFYEWALQFTDIEKWQTYYTDGTPEPIPYQLAEREAFNKHKLLVAARLNLGNPTSPTLTTDKAKSTVWRIKIPNLTRTYTDHYGREKSDVYYKYVNTEKTVQKYFDNLKALYPYGNFQEDEGDEWYAGEKSFTINIPYFGRYRWDAREYRLAYNSPTKEEKRRKKEVAKRESDRKRQERKAQKNRELKEKYGAENYNQFDMGEDIIIKDDKIFINRDKIGSGWSLPKEERPEGGMGVSGTDEWLRFLKSGKVDGSSYFREGTDHFWGTPEQPYARWGGFLTGEPATLTPMQNKKMNAETSGQWEIGEQLEEAQMNADYYNAPTKGIDTFTKPFEESSLDSGTVKSIIVGLGIGGLALIGYNKWK